MQNLSKNRSITNNENSSNEEWPAPEDRAKRGDDPRIKNNE